MTSIALRKLNPINKPKSPPVFAETKIQIILIIIYHYFHYDCQHTVIIKNILYKSIILPIFNNIIE